MVGCSLFAFKRWFLPAGGRHRQEVYCSWERGEVPFCGILEVVGLKRCLFAR